MKWEAFAAIVAILSAGANAAPERVLRVAVFDLQVDTTSRVGNAFVQTLTDEIAKLDRVDVISADDIKTMLDLEAEKQALGCDEENSCLAEIADALGAEIVLTGSVEEVGNESFVQLRKIKQADAQVVERFQARLKKAGGEEVLAIVGPAIAKLFPERRLRAGETRGVDPAVAALLNPPPIPAWAFWTAAGTGAAALLAGGGVMLGALAPYGAATELSANTSGVVSSAEVKRLYDDANAMFITGQGALAIGVVLAVGSAVMAGFTDFQNAGAAFGGVE